MFSLVFGEKEAPRRHTVPAGETSVGRSSACGIVVDDPSVTRRHARLTVSGARCKVFDLNTTNGTFVNGEPVTEAELSDGDTVLFGDIPARVEWSAEDRLTLNEDRELIESSGTMFRPIARPGAPRLQPVGGPVVVDVRRLLGMMSEISRTLVRPQPLMTVLNKVVDLAFGSISAERAFLMLVDEGTKTVVPRVARTRDGSSMPRARDRKSTRLNSSH